MVFFCLKSVDKFEMTIMRVAKYSEFGAAKDVLSVDEIPKQPLGDNEVSIEIRTSAVNPSDVKKRAGAFPDLLNNGYVIPHSDGAGKIIDVGKNISEKRIGERVWIYQGQFEREHGTAAEFINIDSKLAVYLPDQASYEIGACIGIPVMTAHRCIFADGPVKGKNILVTGGAGRVGYYAIQWGKLFGARVIATASNNDDKKACLDIGADGVVNHREEEWELSALDANHGEKFDRVVDVEFGANLENTLNILKTGATIATYSSTQDPNPKIPFLKMMYMDLTVRLVIVYAMPEKAKNDAIKDINDKLSSNELSHRVAKSYHLDDIAKGHELIESNSSRGCVLINIY